MGTGRLAAVLLVGVAALAGLALSPGALTISLHEGDALHLAEIALRMARGEVPHRDFMTPLGALSAGPVALWMAAGAGFGMAFLLAQAAVALILLPAAARAGASRLPPPLALAFGGVVMVLVLALVHGGGDGGVSISMHYNRWAWALAFVAILLAVLPARAGCEAPVLDGVIAGLCMAALALLKATYLAAFLIPVMLGFALRREWGAIVAGLLAGVLVAGAVTAVWGIGFWPAYLGDLLAVARSATRSQPGADVAAILAAPQWLLAGLATVAGVILLRRSGRGDEGLLLLLLFPGFVYVTWQNWGNDPQWVWLVAILLAALRPVAGSVRTGLGALAVALLAYGSPSLLNLAYSLPRHRALAAEATALLPRGPLADLRLAGDRSLRPSLLTPVALPGVPASDAPPLRAAGEALPDCQVQDGTVGWWRAVAGDLAARGHAGAGVFAADVLSPLGLFGFRPLRGGAPWSYGGLDGLDDADLVLVPLCPRSPETRAAIVAALTAAGTPLREVGRSPLYILFSTAP